MSNKEFITRLPQYPQTVIGKTKHGLNTVEKVVILRELCSSHGVMLGLADAKRLVDLNECATYSIHDYMRFVKAVMEDHKEDTKI